MVPDWFEQAAPIEESDPLYILMREEEDDIDTTEDVRLGMAQQILVKDSLESTSDDTYSSTGSVDMSRVIDKRVEHTIRSMIKRRCPFEQMLQTLTRMGISHDEAVDMLLVADPQF